MKVAVIMGSSSDSAVMRLASEVLRNFGVAVTMTVVSAHRSPDRMVAFAKSAADSGFEIIIAGAGGAAHLPGMVASLTTLPVIGVPVRLEHSPAGLDALFSMVQMPAGVPVATVGINNAENAGLLAVRMLAIRYPELRDKLLNHQVALQQKALQQAQALESEQQANQHPIA